MHQYTCTYIYVHTHIRISVYIIWKAYYYVMPLINLQTHIYTHTHTHTDIHDIVYIWMGVCTLGGACALMNRFCHASSSYHQTHVHLRIHRSLSIHIHGILIHITSSITHMNTMTWHHIPSHHIASTSSSTSHQNHLPALFGRVRLTGDATST